jgi:nitrogen-specific signal transduction histidine kinase
VSTWLEVGNPVQEGLFEYLPQAVVLLDDQLRVELGNRAASDLFRLSQAALTGMPITALVPRQDLAKLLVDSGEERIRTIEIEPSPDQEPQSAKILKITIVRLPGDPSVASRPTSEGRSTANGSPRLLVLEDVTDRVMMEDQLVQTEKLAAMGQLASGIAHELANPLSSLSSNVQYVW